MGEGCLSRPARFLPKANPQTKTLNASPWPAQERLVTRGKGPAFAGTGFREEPQERASHLPSKGVF